MSTRPKRCIRSSSNGELVPGWPRDHGSGACGIGECRTAGISRSVCDSMRTASIIFKTCASKVSLRRFRKPLGDQATSAVLTTSCERPLLVCECSAAPGSSRLESHCPPKSLAYTFRAPSLVSAQCPWPLIGGLGRERMVTPHDGALWSVNS